MDLSELKRRAGITEHELTEDVDVFAIVQQGVEWMDSQGLSVSQKNGIAFLGAWLIFYAGLRTKDAIFGILGFIFGKTLANLARRRD